MDKKEKKEVNIEIMQNNLAAVETIKKKLFQLVYQYVLLCVDGIYIQIEIARY